MIVLDDMGPAARTLLARLQDEPPEYAIVLGSGLGGDPSAMREEFTLPLSQLCGFPETSVTGHRAMISVGTLHRRRVLFFHGRYHFYEGYSAWQVTAQVRLAAATGCSKILLTNAAGGISARMTAGDFMLVTDHLNLTGQNPLIGRNERRFLDIGNLYCHNFYPQLCAAVKSTSMQLHSGVLAWMTGPNYETPAEINFLEQAGADAVSMSTVPEAIVARLYGMEVSALSLIANPAAGRGNGKLDHQDVLTTGSGNLETFHLLLEHLLKCWR
ncbi:MAG: purine-nucleoside phosphorylase [Pelovirga sp.]